MKLSDKDIIELFNNDIFKNELNKYIINNLKISQTRDIRTGKYDEIYVTFFNEPIIIKTIDYGL